MAETFKCRLISFDEVYELSFRLSLSIKESGFKPDIIVAISRGGFTPARLLCDFLDISDLTSVKVQHYQHGAQKEKQAYLKFPLSGSIEGKKVLLADDVNDTGESLRVAYDHLQKNHPQKLKTAVLHEKDNTTFKTDYYQEFLKEWRWIIYPWAQIEDLGNFIEELEPPVHTIEEASRKLRKKYDITVPDDQLRRIFQILELPLEI